MAIRRTLAQFSDEIVAADIAANAVGASELANDAVAAANIIDGSVGSNEMAASVIGVKPHIIPGVLYPAVAGKLLDGSTSHGATYGVAQADGFSYYYTDIKGSKPIKDPRIGAHFGSQRHDAKSIQLLEQETATHGANVYSIDGRENVRLSGTVTHTNDSHGTFLLLGTSAFIEIVGYFTDANISAMTWNVYAHISHSVDGGSSTANTTFRTTEQSPIKGRYVPCGSLGNLGRTDTLGIHTLKIVSTDQELKFYGFELIAQDTTSTTTKSQIQIPSQNVVSYGKKFTVAETKHYNPFAFKTDGSTAWASGAHNGTAWPIGTGSSTNIDTATSLGLAAWVSTNYYKPYNGGRVVKWIASDGTIKTSVNMMPPNARNISSTASNEKGDDSGGTTSAAVANTQPLPTFTDIAIDHSQAEVAKTFNWRELGNGAANGGTGATYADASMLNTEDDIAYVMDDGLTSLSAKLGNTHETNLYVNTDGTGVRYITFIGTGISVNMKHSGAGDAADDHRVYIDGVDIQEWDNTSQSTALHWEHYVQNLPYGTHILKIARLNEVSSVVVDKEYSFHQPKMPPIPEDAVVLADYMLMADFVKKGTVGIEYISKGTRRVHASRDFFYNNGTFTAAFLDVGAANGGYAYFNGTPSSGTNNPSLKVPVFATNGTATVHGGLGQWWVDGVSTADSGNTTGNNGAYLSLDSDQTLGVHDFEIKGIDSTANSPWSSGIDVASPIHTSSHYQTFETPFLHELVGGDRNMEQTNLVVTPDGKTWDEVTRDVGYIGNASLSTGVETTFASNVVVLFDDWRATSKAGSGNYAFFNKDFAIAYDRIICLRDGDYQIHAHTISSTDGYVLPLFKNGSAHQMIQSIQDGEDNNRGHSWTINDYLKRGDYLVLKGQWEGDNDYSRFLINRI